MSQIWRFPVEPGVRDFFVNVPAGSRLLKLVMKDGEPQLYFKVPDPKAARGDVMFFCVPSGVDLTELEDRAIYLDSFTIAGPPTLVFHLLLESTNA